MKIKHFALIVILAAPLSGCAAQTQIDFQPAAEFYPENTMTVGYSMEKTWDAAIRAVSEDFFVLDNIERASNIITLSYAINDPEKYLDCGTLTYTNSGGMSGRGSKSTNGAAQRFEYLMADGTSEPKKFVRTTSLSGRINIVMSVEEKDKTNIKVNTRYILLVHRARNVLREIGYSTWIETLRDNYTVTFNGGQTGMADVGSEPIQCVTRYTLEKAIFDGILKKIK